MIKTAKKTKNAWEFLSIGSGSKYPLNGGLCLESQPSAIKLNQSPDMLNLNTNDRGTYAKRSGQAYTTDTFAGSKINALYENYKGYLIIAAGTKLYRKLGTAAATEVYSGIVDTKVALFEYNGYLYVKDGTNYLQYDGSTISTVTPYKPITSYLRKPDGSDSTSLESINLLGSGFRNQFNGDATSKDFYLDRKGLDATTVTAVVDGVIITEGAGLTVDRTNGKVSFTVAPSDAGVLNKNNVEITAYKTYSGNATKILQCTIVKEFSNVLFMSKGDNIWYVSEIPNAITPAAIRADYFPESRQYSFGSDNIKGFMVQYDKLIVFRENSLLTVSKTDSAPTERVEYPISLLNDGVGCIAPDSIQLLNNVPVFLSSKGVQLIYSTLVQNEKNVINISQNINGVFPDRPGLQQESNLQNAVSYDDGKKYWICLNGNAYVLDYDVNFDYTNPRNLCWFKYDNINANCFYSGGYGHSTQAKLVNWITAKNDFGQYIHGYWYSKLIDFDSPNFYKTVTDLWVTTRANASSSITVNFFDGNGVKVKTLTLPKSKTKSFSWSNFSWSDFTWAVQQYGKPLHVQYNLNDIVYFQIQLENNNFNEDLSLITLLLKYTTTRMVR